MIGLLRALCLAILLPLSALAQPVAVTTGDHDGFTRLVLDYGKLVDWQVGRTADGYEVRLSGATPAYDLTGVYDLIGRGRLASVWVAPETGQLRIGVGCGCHAMPFEFRPGIVVIDIKEGPPPKGSSFETSLDGNSLPDIATRPARRPRARPPQTGLPQPSDPRLAYDWTDLILKQPTDRGIEAGSRLVTMDPALQPLRTALLQHLSRGAAQGMVDLAVPAPAAAPETLSPTAQMRLSQLPGLRIDANRDAPVGLSADGQACIADSQVDLGAWGTDRPVAEQMAGAMAGLMGEFDIPDPVATLRAVRFLLFIGFGAEARQLLVQMPDSQPDVAILTSLAHTLDSTHDPEPAFAGMAACDTAAALWTILSEPAPERGSATNRPAALRAFSALPVHLRRILGPPLADRFIARGEADAAETVRHAILRAPGESGPEVTLMESRMDLDGGHPTAAEQRLKPLIEHSGPATPDALIALVATHFALRKPLDPAQITALEGFLHERRNTPDDPRFARALTLARALAGDYEAAFADLAEDPAALADVWTLLAETGPDSAVLTHAILLTGSLPQVPATVAERLSHRLLGLGFATQAENWLAQVAVPQSGLAAQIALDTGDARSALRLIAGSDDPSTLSLRSAALLQLGDQATLAAVLAEAGEDDGRWRAVSRARDWPQLAATGPEPWKAAALSVTETRLSESGTDEQGPLSDGQAMLTSAAKTRQAVVDLLAFVAQPAR